MPIFWESAMKKLVIILFLFPVYSVFADITQAPVSNTPEASQQLASAQVSMTPNNESTQQINQYFDKSRYKFFKKNHFEPLFQVKKDD